MSTIGLQLSITETHITLTRSEPEAVLASMALDVLRCDPGAQAAWRQLCGAAIAAMAVDVCGGPAVGTAPATPAGRPHTDARVAAAR